ncbi:MAG: DUF3828 domain-containing protein [Acidobacteria bacterium]|nr:DUF3828 domain-containing protein [Acidobacteriota bacterium]
MTILLSIFFLLIPTPHSKIAQAISAPSRPATSQTATAPEAVVKDFYRWYIERLNRNRDPLTQEKTTLKKYLTPEFFRKAPKLLDQTDADVFICAQDWDKDWGKHITIANLQVQGSVATMKVTLSGSSMNHKLKVKLKQLNGAWKIDKIDPLDL